jgi:pilus assembly protein CpaE
MPPTDISALSGNWKALLISPNKTITAELHALVAQRLPHTAVFEMPTYPARHVLAEMGGAQGPNLCFLDLVSDQDRGLLLIAELLAVQPAIKIVVLLASKNPDTILKAMRQGAAEFFAHPFDTAQFDSALERIASLQFKDTVARGHIICLMPSKGACGATTIASSMAQHYKRAGFKKILLADMDPLTGTLSFLLKLKSNYSFLDALSRSHSLDADIWKGIVTSRSGIDILLSPETVQEGLHDLRDASSIIEFARSFYEVVILDTGTPYGEWNTALARMSDDLVLVSSNELPALQSAQRAINYLEVNHVNRARIRFVVNRYSKDLGLSRDAIETALNCDVFHTIPSDYESVNTALMEGKPIPPNTNFGKALAQLGDRLCARAKQQDEPPKKTSALSSLFSLFSKSS